MKEGIKPRSFGTHDGSFHADEVTACALLVLFDQIDKENVKRSRDPEILSHCEFVCDVGGSYDPDRKRFDHHQVEYGGPMSSAGMVLKYLRDQRIINQELYDYFNKSLIMGVDAHDNGVAKSEVGFCSFSQVVSNFLPVEYSINPKDYDETFFQALEFVIGHLSRLQKRFLYTLSCKEKVRACMAKSTYVMIYEESLPWLENFFNLGGENHPALFVLMPTGVHWKLRAIPPNLKERMKVRKPLPAEWAGLHEKDLQKISKIPGAIFCHKGRFISIWKTKEDALKALDYVMKS